MMRLVEKGLMYGNLVEVSTPALVERYNAALEKMTGRRTQLDSFHIDLSGFAPEIGEEFDDHLYLNPNGCNRQFILLSMEQKSAPLLNSFFSTSRSILRRFIEDNAAPLFALTARDAVIGELENSIYRVRNIGDVLSVRRIRIDADTTTGLIVDGARLRDLIARFDQEEDAWWDEEIVAEMVQIAQRTGDVARHPLSLDHLEYDQGNFHTRHFGGLYVFRELSHPAIVSVIPAEVEGELTSETIIDIADVDAVAAFLNRNDLVEEIFDADGLDAGALLRQRLDFILIDHIAQREEDLTGLTRRDLRSAMYRWIDEMPEVFHELADVVRWLAQGGEKPALDPDNPAYFYTLRARSHADRDLVNMLLAELIPHDIRHLFICHKTAFYEAYAGWSDAKRGYVAEFLASEYAIDKAGTREALFGAEPSMDAEAPSVQEAAGEAESHDQTTPVAIGPWGPRSVC